MVNSILVVDDKKINIDMLTQILKTDYTVMAAISGESAIRVMERRQPDLVLLDMYMPGMDGLEVLSHMMGQTLLSAIPVIFVTGEQDSYMEEKCLDLGAVDYIRKPYNATIIRYKIRNYIDLKNYRDHLEAMVAERTKELASSRESIIMGMSLLSESHDKVTGDHIERIKQFTKILCMGMCNIYPDLMPPQMVDAAVLYSPLHDVGKASIADGILKKNSSLTPHEFDVMKTHTVNGGKLLRKTEEYIRDDIGTDDLDVAIEIAESHHERFDGSGYPHGLKGDDIPISARIVAIADVYDALCSVRPYKKAFTHEQAMDIILKGDGRTRPEHFDPRALEVFRTTHKEFQRQIIGR